MTFMKAKELKKIKKYLGDHPFPSERNINATKEIISLLADTKRKRSDYFIVSGGDSTLLCQPTKFTCNNEKQIMECLFKAGAEIEEINTIGKHISIAPGGFLAKYAYPAQVVGLIFPACPSTKRSLSLPVRPLKTARQFLTPIAFWTNTAFAKNADF